MKSFSAYRNGKASFLKPLSLQPFSHFFNFLDLCKESVWNSVDYYKNKKIRYAFSPNSSWFGIILVLVGKSCHHWFSLTVQTRDVI